MDTPYDPEQIIRNERALRDRQAASYDDHLALDRYLREVEDACFWEALDLSKSHSVLDAGCGPGRHLSELLARADRVIGIDHSAESVALAHSRVPREDLDRVELTSGDVRKMPFDDAIVDRVMCCEVIQHIPTAELRLQAIREFRRVLRPGGLAVISVYRWLGHVKRHRDGFWGEDLYRHAFTARELRRLIADAGFENVSVGGIGILPGLSERVGISPKRQARLAFTPLGRHLAHYLVARAWKPEP